MVRKWDDRGTHSQNHTWVDLAVGVSDGLRAFVIKVLDGHGNHSTLFLFHVQKFNKSLLTTGFKIPSAPVILALSVEHHLDVPLAQLQLVFFNHKKRPLHAACVSAELNLFAGEVTHQTDLTLDTTITSECNEVSVESVSV